jgi:pilus assembly protein Flp/PilA
MDTAQQFLPRTDEAGASSVEYALLVSLIAVVILVAVVFFGQTVKNLFTDSCSSVATAAQTTCN